jgi:hypothetical protein
MGSKLNKIWHEQNKMPKNPSLDERIKWHLEHAKHCACRPIPAKLLLEMKRKSAFEPRQEISMS